MNEELGRLLKRTGDNFEMSGEIPRRLLRRIAARRLVAAGALVVVVAAAGVGTALAITALEDPTDPARERSVAAEPTPSPSEVPGWNFSYDEKGAFSIGHPENWYRARESLTPKLAEPAELVSLATFELVYRESDCDHMPASALEDIGADDAFVSIQEGGGGDLEAYRPRPPDFEDEAEPDRGFMCTPEDVEVYWMNFRDSGRGFYALVAFGPGVSAQTRDEAWAVLNSFEPWARG